MGEDDNGTGYTAGICMISDLKSDDASSKWCKDFSFAKVWEVFPQLEYPFSNNWSTDGWLEHPIFSANWSTGTWFGGETESVADIIPYLSDRCALPSLVLICLITALVLIQPVKKTSPRPKRTPRPGIASEWNDLPADIQGRVIGRLPFEQVCQLKAVSKTLRDCIEDDEFLSLLHFDSVTLTAPYFFIKDGVLQCSGYDSFLKKWRRLPPITYLPDYCTPDPDLFKEYLVCTQDGVVCVNVSKSTEEKLIVFNLLTGKWKLLPPLNHRRNPVLMHMLVDAATHSFQVIVAGSSKSGEEHLSRMTEEFDSRTWTWKRTGDLPGPDYALNDYQCGVRIGGYLLCIAFLDHDSGRGILRYNLTKGIWLKNWTYPLPFAMYSTILQLLENRGDIYVFSEQSEAEGGVQHCVDRLDRNFGHHNGIPNGVDSWTLRNVVRQKKKTGGRSLEIYPEYVCVGYSDSQLVVFNAMDHSGVVYNVKNYGTREEVLEAPTGKGFSGDGFYSLNPLSFAIQPSFRLKI